MRHMKVIDDERGIETWINPMHVTMWRAHWMGPEIGCDSALTDVFFPGEGDALVVRLSPASFAVDWWVAMSYG